MKDKKGQLAGATDGSCEVSVEETMLGEAMLNPAVMEDGILAFATEMLRVAAEVDADLMDRKLYTQQLLACRGGKSSTSLNAAVALNHWRLKKNDLGADRLSIQAALGDEIDALRPLLLNVADQKFKIDLLRIDLEQAKLAEERHSGKREVEILTDLYEAARNVVRRLYEDHGIAEGHWFAISEEGLPALSELIRRETDRAGFGSPLQPALKNKRRAKRSR